MQVFHNPHHSQHRPPHEIFNGNREIHQESPERAYQILRAIAQTSHVLAPVELTKKERRELLRILRSVHSSDYLSYLEQTDFDEIYRYPSVFSYRDESSVPEHQVARLGYYSFDMYTPVNKTTFESALNSAYLAMRTAQDVLNDATAYALCRPPGHHAEPARMGGYCYLNNAAVAAQTLREANTSNRVAILDVDFHHGNGAEKIFGTVEEILTVSIHADPKEKFPFFSGHRTNAYTSNQNYPLPLGTTNREYAQVLASALEVIREHGTTHLVVCFGADTHESDPIGGFRLTTEFYTEMARQIHSLGVPIAIIQEGGYNSAVLGDNVVAFLNGFS